MADIFISHVEEDRKDAEILLHALEDEGYSVWIYERDTLPGRTYINQIIEAIDHIHVLILIISDRALHSAQVDREIVRAFQHGKSMLPILININYEEFQRKKPDWDHMIGAAGALVVPSEGLTVIVQRVINGVKAMLVGMLDIDITHSMPNMIDQPNNHLFSLGENQIKDPDQTLLNTGARPENAFNSDAKTWRLIDFAKEMGMTTSYLMRYAREILKVEIRTPSSVLSLKQIEQLRQSILLSKQASYAVTTKPPLQLDLGSGVTMELIFIPAGRFKMGSPPEEEGYNDDETVHDVVLSRPFYLGRYLVTQKQFKHLMEFDPSYFEGEKLPVEMVSWFDAISFCEALLHRYGKAFRLPTEAEWEYACRAGTTTAFNTGLSITTDNANFDGKFTYGGCPQGLTRWTTSPFGTFNPNPWGIYDMHGNVWEWCSDWYGKYDKGSVTNPVGPSSGEIRVLRGGSWFNGPADCRSAQRDALDPGRRHSLYGFRVALSIE